MKVQAGQKEGYALLVVPEDVTFQNCQELRQQFDRIAEFVRPGVLMGEGQELIDRVGEYVDAGAEAVILAVRTPFDLEALDRFAETVIPAFASK